MNKYRNVITEVDGIKFDSRKEAARYSELKLLEKAGEISILELQPAFSVEVSGKKICTYKADFSYFDIANSVKRGYTERVVEDVKSPATRKNPTYRLKKNLVEAIYGIEIREV